MDKARQSSRDEMLVLAGIRIKMKKHHRYTKNCTHGIVAQLLAQWDMIILQRNKVHTNFNKLFMPQGAEHPGFRETLYSKIQFYGKFPQQGRWKISPTGKLEKKKAGQCLAVS